MNWSKNFWIQILKKILRNVPESFKPQTKIESI